MTRSTTTTTEVLALALLLFSVVFSVLLIGEKRLERKFSEENTNLWNEVMSKTVACLKAEAAVENLKHELEEIQTRDRALFDPQALTPSEGKKKK